MKIAKLETIIKERSQADPADSYSARLLQSGLARVAQKVGEEAVELVHRQSKR